MGKEYKEKRQEAIADIFEIHWVVRDVYQVKFSFTYISI